jgi:hypothetical protein
MREVHVKQNGVYSIQYTSWKEFKSCTPYETSYLNQYTLLWYSLESNPIQLIFQYSEREFQYSNMVELRIKIEESEKEEVKRWIRGILYKQYEEILGAEACAEDGPKVERGSAARARKDKENDEL